MPDPYIIKENGYSFCLYWFAGLVSEYVVPKVFFSYFKSVVVDLKQISRLCREQ
jgi:hypothetical protein